MAHEIAVENGRDEEAEAIDEDRRRVELLLDRAEREGFDGDELEIPDGLEYADQKAYAAAWRDGRSQAAAVLNPDWP